MEERSNVIENYAEYRCTKKIYPTYSSICKLNKKAYIINIYIRNIYITIYFINVILKKLNIFSFLGPLKNPGSEESAVLKTKEGKEKRLTRTYNK